MKNIYSINKKNTFILRICAIGLFVVLSIQLATAQKNLAPTATAAASTCNTGACSTLNNQVINSACTQEMWITTTTPPSTTPNVEWFDFTWTSPQSINSVTIWHGNTGTRFLAGADVYIWNAITSAYVYSFTFSGLSNTVCVNTVKFPFNVTTLKLRFTKFQASGSQLSNMNFREIEIWQGSTKLNDVGISALQVPLCAPTLVATYTNFGTNTVDSAKINWSVNGTLQNQMRYNTPTTLGNSANVTLTPTFNFIDGNNYTVKTWTSLPNNKTDSVATNDTSKITFQYQGPAGTPGVKDVIKCGPGQAPLVATPVNKGDSILWYNAATGGSVIAKGKNTLSPPLVLGSNTFYAQAFKMSSPIKLANGMTGPTYCTAAYLTSYVGSMMDFVPKGDIVVDSLGVDFYQLIANTTYSVYYKTNTYVGFEANSTAWTPLIINGKANVQAVGTKNRGYLKIPSTSLAKGVTYGFYITTVPITGNDLFATSGTSTWSDANLSVSGGKYIYGAGLFGTQIANWYIDLEVYYKTQSCPSSRVPVLVTVKPSPKGAAFVKSTPFQSTMPNTIGSKGNPDIVAKGDQLTYEITPPTGYNNSDYGVTWIMSGFTLKTQSGRVLSTSYYSPSTPTPSGSANAKVTFTADAAIVDSNIIMTVAIFDLGPHYCDSLLTRNIRIAPRPVADFSFIQPVCDGDNVIFTNKTTYSSGNATHKWDFNTGNPADTSIAADVVFTFPTYGTYNVSLVSTSVPYGYKDTKTYTVVVSEIPKIGFKVFNACLGDSVKFINSTTISSGTIDYKWDLGNGAFSTKVNPSVKYTVAGGYKVTLTATYNGCKSVMTKNAQQFARPVAKYSAPSVLCDKSEILFTNGSTIPLGNMGYVWYFGDGIISGETNPYHSFSSTGTKTVKMKAISEFGCADSVTKTLNLAEAPLANFSATSLCNLTPTQFNFTGTKPSGALTTFAWNFAGEGTTTVENPSKLFSLTGKKLITLTLTSNNGCSDITSKEIDIKLQSKADFSTLDVCEGNDAVFTNKSTVAAGNLLYNWKFGDGKNSISQSPRHLYPTGISQTYNVTLVAIVPGGCSDSINKPISVNAKPNSDFTFKPSGRLVSFAASQTSNTSYQWNFSDGGSSSAPVTQYHYQNYPSGKYTVCLSVVNAAGCISQTCKEVSISGGINELSKASGIDVYPNPNGGNFTVTVENPKSDISIAVYNLLGDVIKVIETNPLKSTYSVDLNVANGIYIVKVTNGGLTSSQKITINK